MTTKLKKQETIELEHPSSSVVVIIEYFDGEKKLKGFLYQTSLYWLQVAREVCEIEGDLFHRNVYTLLVDETGKFKALFQDGDEAPILQSSEEFESMFLTYCSLGDYYLGGFDGVSKFLETENVEYMAISIKVDVSDYSKTRIVGSFFKDGCEDENVDYPLN